MDVNINYCVCMGVYSLKNLIKLYIESFQKLLLMLPYKPYNATFIVIVEEMDL